MVRGRPRHIVAYIKDFLFDERQARGPVKALSGGERARLLLAKIMARESNLLVLDEPTNDLDVETLDLLQELLADFDGTVLLVSHDRDFIDRVATSVIALEDGQAVEYAGGYTDHLAQKAPAAATPIPAAPPPRAAARPERPKAATFGYAQQRRLEQLPGEMEKLEREIARLESFLADPELYARDPAAFTKATAALALRQETLAAAEEEWLTLEEKRESAVGS
jgi:ATP-binding cassette subfamily F protein uup